MSGGRRRGFDWEEVAEVLHMSRAVAQATFRREIKRPRSKGGKVQSPAIVTPGERDSDSTKLGRPRASR